MMRIVMAFAALAAPCCEAIASAQAAPAFSVDSLTAVAGRWSYRSFAGGSEAAFADAAGTRLALRCNRAVRTVSVVRTGVPAASATLSVWTRSLSRSVPARFESASALTADLAATDPLLDAIALGGGKFATSALGAPLTAYPSWAETTRVVEDCRS